jgi:hypothetical protein
MGEGLEKNADALRIRARDRITQGKLPRAAAARIWGGPGAGAPCDLCDFPILSNEPEFELQMDSSNAATVVRLHRLCHAVWDTVRQEALPGPWIAVSDLLPPIDTVVESRVSLGETRSIVLNVVRVHASGAPGWLNPLTREPLPAGWQPIAWRQPAIPGAEPSSPGDTSVSQRA